MSRSARGSSLKSDLLKSLIRAHTEGDERAFRKTALQIAATESAAGHIRIADEIRDVIAALPPAGSQAAPPSLQTVDISHPRGPVSDLLVGGFRDERLVDIVLPSKVTERIKRILRENRQRRDIESWGMPVTRKVLFHGPPGCGKTLAAKVIAGELGLPLMTVRLDGLFSRFLGATASHLKTIFDEMPKRPAVYLFDEFDAIVKNRGDLQEVGEMRRVVTSFLQLMDADRSGSLIIAATNYDEILDRAVFRRFDVMIPFRLPSVAGLEGLIRLRLKAFLLKPSLVHEAARRAEGLSFADVARACDDAVRTMILARRKNVERGDLLEAIDHAVERLRPTHSTP